MRRMWLGNPQPIVKLLFTVTLVDSRLKMDEAREHFGFLLMPDFPLAPVASAVDVLALANYVSEEQLYRWCTLSLDSPSVAAMNGFHTLADHKIANAPPLDAIVVCCGIGGSGYATPEILSWLRDRHVRGVKIGAISTGSWLLARAGLLDGRRCTVHWEDLAAFRETFPDLRATSEIFEVDGRIFTCSGGSAAIDMFLSFVAVRHGSDLAAAVSEQLVHGPLRSDHTSQRLEVRERTGLTHQTLLAAVGLMESNLEAPIPMGEIAKTVGVSSRHLERLFRKHLGRTPQLYYRELRLRRAQALLRSTAMPVSEVAFAFGFSTSSYFAKCYLDFFGRLPASERTRPAISQISP